MKTYKQIYLTTYYDKTTPDCPECGTGNLHFIGTTLNLSPPNHKDALYVCNTCRRIFREVENDTRM